MKKEQLVSTVEKAQAGDHDALNTLFCEYYDDIHYFILKIVKDPDLAYDITQETFIEIMRTINNLRTGAAFVTWAKQIAYHQCTRYFKKEKEIILDEDEDGNTPLDTLEEDKSEFIPHEALDRDEFKKAILDILDTLTPDQRGAVMMYYFDELSLKQIAEIQAVPVGTVKSRLNYSRKKLKESVEEYEKKHNIRLHALPLFPIFKLVFDGAFKGSLPAAKIASLAQGVSTATGVGLSSAGAAGAAGAAVAAGGMSLGAKIAAGIIAAAVAAGGTFATIALVSDGDEEAREEADSSYENSFFLNESNFAYDLNAVSVKPRYVYWENGELVAECFVINGFDHNVYNVDVTALSFSTPTNGTIAYAEDFGILEGVVIPPYSYITWTFRFTEDCVESYGANLSETLTCRCSTSNSY